MLSRSVSILLKTNFRDFYTFLRYFTFLFLVFNKFLERNKLKMDPDVRDSFIGPK